jgi:hypothetical protein
MPRKVADCRDYPSESHCTLTISGEENEVLAAAKDHAIKVHKHEDTPELTDQIRGLLKDEKSTAGPPENAEKSGAFYGKPGENSSTLRAS